VSIVPPSVGDDEEQADGMRTSVTRLICSSVAACLLLLQSTAQAFVSIIFFTYKLVGQNTALKLMVILALLLKCLGDKNHLSFGLEKY